MAPKCRLAVLGVLLIEVVEASKALLKGISYGPSPRLSLGTLPNDDFMCESARPQWGSEGRGDLRLMAKMGANAVRLYGNDPRENHAPFLDEAHKHGLGVIPGLSDWPYVQAPESCAQRGYNCYDQVKEAYLQSLRSGFLQNGSYHPALKYIIAVNEPDMKMPHIGEPAMFTRALVSALDGMLDAEKEAGVTGPLPNFTVTFSFSICDACGGGFKTKPGLGQMWQLRNAMENPNSYNYRPRNDLAKFFRTRFVNSFNTANPSFELRSLFLAAYEETFPTTPVFIAEYHSPNMETAQDVSGALKVAEASPLMLGVSFFEWVNRRDEQGHTTFGIFELGTKAVGNMAFFGDNYEVRCLAPALGAMGELVPVALSRAFGGTYKAGDGCEALPTTTTTTTTTTSTSTTTTDTTTDGGHDHQEPEPDHQDPEPDRQEPEDGSDHNDDDREASLAAVGARTAHKARVASHRS